ncbi:MAG: T9SS type A sorting domain-containing protein, partial [bacterium]
VKYDGYSITVYDTSNSSLSDKYIVSAITIDDLGNKWICTYGGLSVFREGGVILTDIEEKNVYSPVEYLLKQNYPNPFNTSTKISYSIQKSDFVTLKVYDILGRELQTLINEYQNGGRYSINFDASRLSSGIYFYRLQVGSNFMETKKMMLMR